MKKYLLPLILILLLTFTLGGYSAWLSGWDYRIELSIGDYAGDIGGSVTWFPVTVFLNPTQGEEVFAELTTDAEYLKVAFTKADGTTELYAEKELFAHTFAGYTSQYPPAHSDDYVKSTTKANTSLWAYFATNPALSLTGDSYDNSWLSTDVSGANQRFHIDLGSAKVIRRIYYENFHNEGGLTNRGVENFTFWGSNTGAGTFDDLVYGNDGGWTQLTISQSTFDQHTASDVADPKYITVTNATAYRYYAFKFADNYGDGQFMGVRRIELQIGEPTGEGEAIFHVSRDGWTIDANTSIFLYYDSTHADNTDYIGVIGLAGRDGVRENVWNPNYKMVQHNKDETTSTITDSTSNNNDGTKVGANEPNEVAGKVGQGQEFDGNNDVINVADNAGWDTGSYVTLEIIFRTSTQQSTRGLVLHDLNNFKYMLMLTSNSDDFHFYIRTTSATSVAASEETSGYYSDGVYRYMAGVYDKTLGSNRLVLYRDGTSIATANGYNEDILAGDEGITLGRYSANYYTGIEDEVRISSNARTSAWIKGTKNTLWDDLFTYGSEEEAPVVGITWNGIVITKWNGVTITIPINTQ